MSGSVEELIKAHGEVKREVYLDLENSSPVPRDIVETMLPYFSEKAYGNPTITHKLGWEAYEVIMNASKQIAEYIDADSEEELNFTPGETEANNLALIGATLANKANGEKVITSKIEHLSIIYAAKLLEKYGFKVVRIPVDGEGFIELEGLSKNVDKNTVLVSLMTVNHEIGTIEPIKEAVEVVKDKNPEVIFHTDACDAYGKIPLNVKRLNIDMVTLSSYKILGPRGIASLYVREGVKVDRILEGQVGTQSLWSGVGNSPLIVGFLKASELPFKNFNFNVKHMKRLRDKLIKGIFETVSETRLNGPRGNKRAPDNVNVSFLYCEGESITIELSLRGIYVSSGSACTRRILQPSHVLTAIGKGFEEAHGSILMKVTRYHTDEDIEYVLNTIPCAIKRLRETSPIKGGM